MNSTKEYLAEKLHNFYLEYGIDPIYGTTVIFIALSLTDIKKLKNWQTLHWHVKWRIIPQFFGTAMFIIICFYKLLGGSKF